VPEHADQPGYMVIYVGDRAVVSAAGRPDVILGDLHAVHRADRAEPALVRMQRRLVVAARGHRDVLAAVEVPPLSRDGERVVRMAERDHVAERAFITRAEMAEQRPFGGERDLVVEIELVGPDAEPGIEHR